MDRWTVNRYSQLMHQAHSSRIPAVRRAVERWTADLVDTSGRNRLIRYRDLKTGTLDLTPNGPIGVRLQPLDMMLTGRAIRLSRLIPDTPQSPGAFGEARRRLTAISRTARTNLEEKGLDTLRACVGLATWKVDQGSTPIAPVILVPVVVTATGAGVRDFSIKVSGDSHLNPVLAHVLSSDHGIDTDHDVAMAGETSTDLESFRTILCRLLESWGALPDLAIEPRVIVSNFFYSSMAMVADLEKNEDLLASSDMIAAIAGDGGARQNLASRISDPNPNRPDTDPPKDEFLPLDADSSQHMAINRALGGESLVIQGPPGTGKSQTIANLITAFVARGKRVLFVAEKRAAIEAVTKRLETVGLDSLLMDMHGGVTSRRELARTLANSLTSIATIRSYDFSDLHSNLTEYRNTLIANEAALHEHREPWKISLYEMMGRLLSVPPPARALPRLSSEAAYSLDAKRFQRIAREVGEWVGLGGPGMAENHPEWASSIVSTRDQARHAFDLVSDIAGRRLPTAFGALGTALNEASLPRPERVKHWPRTARFLEVANGPPLGRVVAQIVSGQYRAAKRALGAAGSLSITPKRVEQAVERVSALSSKLADLAKATGSSMDHMSHADLAASLERMASDRSAVAILPRLRELETRFDQAGISDVLERVGKEVSPEHASRAVEYASLRRIVDDLEFEDQRIAIFDADRHTRLRDEFVSAEHNHLGSTPERVLRLVAEAVTATMNEHAEETALIRREAAKRRRHLSVRQLLALAPNVLTTLKPCWTMSPILVSEMIPVEPRLFDVVIFDEASQIPPAEAVGSLARAPQAVIAGDSRQLPPTSFFRVDSDREDDDDDDHLSLTGDIESLLDTGTALLQDQMLQWHYRSRDDRLIAFSNRLIYGGALTAFPGTLVSTPVRHCLIPFRPITGVAGTRSNPDEVTKVVDLVLEHAREHPHETLGVIAFGQHHANHIENALLLRLRDIEEPDLDEFFSETNEERFFIKNIERVQGDERDVIIISVGYHKDVNGRLPYRFGPILQEGGERRLNVAVTRSRSRIILVSSFSHRDMDPGRSSAKGVDLLRRYLAYVASGGENLGSDVTDVPLNPFELSIKNGLEDRGIPITPQYGVSGYRIDFACAHPDQPGRMVLAIEADGASYHSARTARDRDRLRQEVLEGKGWRFHRIWSTAWFRNKDAELDRAEAAWRRAVEASDREKDRSPMRPELAASGRHERIPSTPSRSGPRPPIPRKGTVGYQNITDYNPIQLAELVRWIESDTLLRTNEDLIREVMGELGFQRTGKRIRAAISKAIEDARS